MPREIPITIISLNSEEEDLGDFVEKEKNARKPVIKLADESFEFYDDEDDDNYSIEELENAVFSELDADDGNDLLKICNYNLFLISCFKDSDIDNVKVFEPDDSAKISAKSSDESFEDISMFEPDERVIPIR